jgi:diadenylate cyclase
VFDWIFESFWHYARPALDIVIIAFLIYRTYLILVQTRAVQLIKGTFIVVLIYFIAYIFRLNTLLGLMAMFFPGIIIAIAIIFQPELRKIFTRIGQGNWFRFTSGVQKYHLESIINSIEVLSLRKRGSLIVLSRHVGLKNVIETGTTLNSDLSSSLLLTIFAEGSQLHDGAVIVTQDKIVAAGCFLPLSEQIDIKRSFGTRHRAALGLAEETDAIVIVVSEENGAISLAYDAQLIYNLTIPDITQRLKTLFEIGEDEEEHRSEE